MFELLVAGGPLMVPIGLCSVISLAIIIERLFSLRRSRILPEDFLTRIQKALYNREISSARNMCEKQNIPIAWVIEAGLNNYQNGRDIMREAIENEASLSVIPRLERYLGGLATIVNVAPMLGLLGTVTGMIRAFDVISLKGLGNPGLLAGGIAEALVTTAAGLIVAIPTSVAYNHFVSRVNDIVIEMEQISVDMINIFYRGG
ncbi:MAG: MotA/TolQ/ExbB proton channel family protein [bacterium]